MVKEYNIEELRSRGIVKLKGDDMYAVWIKTACCNLSSEQLYKLADISENYARGYLLFTTRQIPMIPFVCSGDLAKVQDELSTVYLTLDRCGPTVRNINVCYDNSICPKAIVNPLSLGEKLDNFFYRPMTHKVKLGVAGCSKDCIITRVLADIGFIGVERNGRTGYDVYVGGRLGLNPSLGTKIVECISENESVSLVDNYFKFLSREGKPGERAADLLNRFGVDRVKGELNHNIAQDLQVEPIDCPSRLSESMTDRLILKLRATCGEVPANHVRKIAEIAEKYGKGFVHFTVRGSPEIPGIEENDLGNIKQELVDAELELIEDGIDNLQSCYGNYCTESNADPQSLLRNIYNQVAGFEIGNMDIKISASGCPNSCGIAHLNDIGFYGVIEPGVKADICTGCELCVSICKKKAIKMIEGVAVIDRSKCSNCGQCIAVCPSDALVEQKRGFAVLVGGREGEDTRLGQLIAEFISEEEALAITKKCLGILKENNSDAATIIDKVGIEKFKRQLIST